MSARTTYIIIGAVLVAIVAVFLLIPDKEPVQSAAEGLPPGHPSVGAQEQGMPGKAAPGAPGKNNVRDDFMAEFRRLGAKVAAQPESDTSDVLMYARMLLAAHQADKALPLLQRYSRSTPRNVDVLLDLSIAWHDTGNTGKAEEVTRSILKIQPDNARALFNLGVLASEAGRNDEARKLWREVIDKHPGTEAAHEAQLFIGQLK
jgi:Flp pilus assembly protein TadD